MKQGDVVIGELSAVRVFCGFAPCTAICGWALWRVFLAIVYNAPLDWGVIALGTAAAGFMSFIGPMMARALLGLPGLYIRDGHVTYLLPFHQYWRIDAIRAAFLSTPPDGSFHAWLTLQMNSGRRESAAVFLFRTPARLMLERLKAAGVRVLDYDPDENPETGPEKPVDV